MSAPGYDISHRFGGMLLVVGFGAAAVLGLLIATVPSLVLVLLVGGPALLVVGSIWPLPALLLGAALLYEVVPREYVMTLGSFWVHELIIGYLTVAVATRAILRGQPLTSDLKEFRWPLFYLLACVSMSVVLVPSWRKTKPVSTNRTSIPNRLSVFSKRTWVPP